MHQQLHLFEETPRGLDWRELPDDSRIQLLRMLVRAASRMLRNLEEVDRDGRVRSDEDQEPPP